MTRQELAIKAGAALAFAIAFLVFTSLIGILPTKIDFELATTKLPEPFTELYFNNSEELPKNSKKGENISFSFAISNKEIRDTKYVYSVYSIIGSTRYPIKEGEIAIPPGEYKSISITTNQLLSVKQRIIVELTPRNQIISFWINK